MARHTARFRRTFGTIVTFGGRDYSVTTRQATGADVGAIALSVELFRVFIASADPRLFVFSAREFHPFEPGIFAPQEGKIIVWHGLNYLVTKLNYGDVHDDTHRINAWCYRYIDQSTEQTQA